MSDVDIYNDERISNEGDVRFEIPKNVRDVHEIRAEDFASICWFSKIDFETQREFFSTSSYDAFPVRVSEKLHYGNISSSTIVKIVTDNRGHYWIKTESGSFYTLCGNPPNMALKVAGAVRRGILSMLGLSKA